MNEDQYEVLIKEIRKLGERLDDAEAGISRIEKDLGDDRVQINDFRVRLASLEERIKEFDRMLARFSQRIKDTVQTAAAEAVEPIMDATQDLTQEIKKKKAIRVTVRMPGIFDKIRAFVRELKSEVKGVN